MSCESACICIFACAVLCLWVSEVVVAINSLCQRAFSNCLLRLTMLLTHTYSSVAQIRVEAPLTCRCQQQSTCCTRCCCRQVDQRMFAASIFLFQCCGQAPQDAVLQVARSKPVRQRPQDTSSGSSQDLGSYSHKERVSSSRHRDSKRRGCPQAVCCCQGPSSCGAQEAAVVRKKQQAVDDAQAKVAQAEAKTTALAARRKVVEEDVRQRWRQRSRKQGTSS